MDCKKNKIIVSCNPTNVLLFFIDNVNYILGFAV